MRGKIKIVQHLVKIWTRVVCLSFLTHGVDVAVNILAADYVYASLLSFNSLKLYIAITTGLTVISLYIIHIS